MATGTTVHSYHRFPLLTCALTNLYPIALAVQDLIPPGRNFNGLQIEVAHVQQPPIFTRCGAETVNGGNWGADLISYQVLGYMQDFLNFTVQFHNASTWGYPDDPPAPQCYDGMALMVWNGQVDLALSNTRVWGTTDFGFLYVTMVYGEIYVYYHATTDSVSVSTDLMIERLPLSVAAGLMTVFLLVTIVALVFHKLRPLSEIFRPPSSFVKLGQKILIPVQETQFPHQRSARIFRLTVLTLTGILCAYIPAILFAQSTDLNVLFRRGYKFGVWADQDLDNSAALKRIQTNSPALRGGKFYKRFQSQDDGIAEVARTPGTAFLSDRNFFRNQLSKLGELDPECNIKQLVTNGERFWGSAFVHPKSKYRGHFNLARLHMAQVGLKSVCWGRIVRQNEESRPACYTSRGLPMSEGVHLAEVRITFAALGIGFALSTTACLAELLLPRIKLWLHRRVRIDSERPPWPMLF